MKNKFWSEKINYIISLPQGHQRDAVRKLRATFPENIGEEWNSEFGKDSLYEAWSQILPMQNIYGLNKMTINKHIKDLTNFTILEVGGGNGALWRNFFNENHKGNFILVDSNENAHKAVKETLPKSINFESVNKNIQDTEIPEADIIVCSLALHHVPGITLYENKKYGVESFGKQDIIEKFLKSIRPKNGILILNESDIYTDIKLKPRTPFLYQKLVDSYIRRACKAIIYTMEAEGTSEDLYQKLEKVIIKWSLEQIERAGNASLQERDVYELDAIHWLDLFENAKAEIVSHKNSDEWNLFHQYILK